jgi:hypothetical protein
LLVQLETVVFWHHGDDGMMGISANVTVLESGKGRSVKYNTASTPTDHDASDRRTLLPFCLQCEALPPLIPSHLQLQDVRERMALESYTDQKYN